MAFQIPKDRKLCIKKNWKLSYNYSDSYIQRIPVLRKCISSSCISFCILFILLILVPHPACADNTTFTQQADSQNPGSLNSNGYSGDLSFNYSNTNENKASFNLRFKTDPLEPEFQDYLENPKNWKSQTYDSNGRLRTLGMLPSPASVSWPGGYKYNPSERPLLDYSASTSSTQLSGAYPAESYFSLADAGRVTPVKDQGTAGACWAFATYASLESCLIPVDSSQWDFSENNMKNLLSNGYSEGFDRTHDAGGNGYMSAAYLTRWTGPVLESDDPYNAASGVSPANKPVKKHVQEVLVLPPRSSATDNGLVKQMVKEKGGVWVSFAVDWNNYGSKDGYSYVTYCNPTVASSGASSHAVCVVGWNDSFDRNQFPSVPAGNGAFICKNSWGTGSGVNGTGYFYISYYDSNLARKDGFSGTKDMYVFSAENTDNYKNIYQYDPLGWTNLYGYTNLSSVWAANVFTARDNEDLKAVGFYTPLPDVNYEIYVYRNLSTAPTGGVLVSNTTGSFKLPGYHTVQLKQAVPLNTGQKFSIVIKTSAGSELKFAGEDRISSYSSKAAANPGESYISSGGTSWADLTSYYPNANLCIKAYTGSSGTVSDTQAPIIRSVILNTSTPETGRLIKISVNATDNVAVSSVETSGSQLNHLSGDLWEGTVTALAGLHTVNVSARDAAGNLAWNNSTSYNANTPDTLAPVIRSVILNNTTPVAGSLIKITVNATDNVAVNSVAASGTLLTRLNGNLWEGTIASIAGFHTVNVSARDSAGNFAWNNSTSYIASSGPAKDTEGPKIISISLYPVNTTKSSNVNVTVNVTDNIGVVNVTAIGNLLKKDGNLWRGSIKASSKVGNYKIPIVALDAAGNRADGSAPYNVVTKKGQLSVSLSPAKANVKKGTSTVLQAKIKNGQNIDETFRIRIIFDGIQTSRRASLSWFSWSEKLVDLRAGQEVTLPLEVKIPTNVTGTRSFQVRADSKLSTTSGSARGDLIIS